MPPSISHADTAVWQTYAPIRDMLLGQGFVPQIAADPEDAEATRLVYVCGTALVSIRQDSGSLIMLFEIEGEGCGEVAEGLDAYTMRQLSAKVAYWLATPGFQAAMKTG